MATVRSEVAFRADPPRAQLVLVSAISPTPAGEGKTTCTVRLTQAARANGVLAACALREPSLGPVFGQKGGGTGGGRSRLITAASKVMAILCLSREGAPALGPRLTRAQLGARLTPPQ